MSDLQKYIEENYPEGSYLIFLNKKELFEFSYSKNNGKLPEKYSEFLSEVEVKIVKNHPKKLTNEILDEAILKVCFELNDEELALKLNLKKKEVREFKKILTLTGTASFENFKRENGTKGRLFCINSFFGLVPPIYAISDNSHNYRLADNKESEIFNQLLFKGKETPLLDPFKLIGI